MEEHDSIRRLKEVGIAPPEGLDSDEALTQLVCLIESIEPDDADQASTPGLQAVVDFATALRRRWDEGL